MRGIITAARRLKTQHWVYFIITLVGVVLTLIWFRKGLLIATGESGDLLINPDRWLHSLRHIWNDTYGTGISLPQYFPMIPFYYVLALLKNLKFSMVLVQGLVFGFLLMSGGLSTYLLTNASVEKDSQKPIAGLIASLFYMLNPYAMTLVWNRFLYSQMFMYASLPLILLLFMKGLEKQRMSYAVFIAGISLIYSVAYTHPANIVVQWLVLLSYLIFFLYLNRKNRARVIYALEFIGAYALLWFLLNAWWILPFSKVIGSFMGSSLSASASENIGSLRAISKHLNLYYVVRLLEYNAIFGERLWGDIYSSAPFQIISWLAPATILLAIILGFRNRFVWYFATLSIFGLFFAKGATPPWRNLLPDFFKLLPVLGIFRNPFEKIGIIIPIGYSFLFGTGLTALVSLFKKRFKIVGIAVFSLIIFIVLVVYPWPMWTGEVFGSWRTPVFARIPEFYARADEWISQDEDDFRILHLPVAPREGIVFTWPHGYEGVELNHVLFGKASISGTQAVRFADELYQRISEVLYTNRLWKIMALFNAKYVVLHNDVDYEASERDSPEELKRALQYTTKLDQTREVRLWQRDASGELALWELFWADRDKAFTTLDLQDTIGQNASFVLDAFPDKGKRLAVVYNVALEKQDLSDKVFLSIWAKSNVPIKFFFGITDWWGRGMTWEGSKDPTYSIDKPEVGKWKHFALLLDKPTAKSDPSLDYRELQMTQIFIGSDTLEPHKRVILKIGEISVAPGKLLPIEGVRYVKTFGELDLFKVEGKLFLKHIYATNQFVFSEDSSSLFDDIEVDSFVPGDKVIFLRSQVKTKDMEQLKRFRAKYVYKPRIVFRKINPAKYVVKVKKASKPFFLVFSETYSPEWKAYLSGRELGSHFIANGYANAYFVSEKGSYDISLEFTPDRLLNLGGKVSIAGIGLSMLILLSAGLTGRKNDN